MKIILDKAPIDLEEYENDISNEWLDLFDEIRKNGKENAFNHYAEMCWGNEILTFDQFNNWLEEESDLIRDSLGLDLEDYDETMNENEYDEEEF